MKEGRAQEHTSHFLAAQALAKVMSFIFWASSFSELSDPNHHIKAGCCKGTQFKVLYWGNLINHDIYIYIYIQYGSMVTKFKLLNIKAFVGNWVVCAQLVQLLIMGDFIYHYMRCIQQGIPVSQLLSSDAV